jgi:hypothetical protein
LSIALDHISYFSYSMNMGKTKRKLHTVYLDPDKHELFMQLSQETRIAQAVLLREAVDDLLKKHRMLKGSRRTE